MPGPSSGVPMNSIPPLSSVFCISTKVEERLGGIPFDCSNLWIVGWLTPERVASFDADQLRAALAALICAPVIILTSLMIFFILLFMCFIFISPQSA